jgi:heme exporter protein A
VLNVEGLAGARGGRIIFRDLAFVLERGHALVLRGPNGAGKSTLLRILAGLLPRDAGRITWDGADVADDREAQGGRTRYVGHLDGLKAVCTVAENLAFAAALAGVTAEARAGAVAAALAPAGLAGLGEVPVGMLSAGQRRRAALARLLVAPATLWLLDEPTVTLDADSVARLEGMMRGHLQGGGLIVAATHTPLDLPHASTLTLGGG